MLSMMNNRKRLHWSQVLSASDKPVTRLALALLLLSLVMGSLNALPVPPDLYRMVTSLQLVMFLALGCWQAEVRNSLFRPLVRNGIDGRLFFTLLIAVMVFIMLGILYIVLQQGELLIAAASAAAYLLPWLLVEQWDQLNALPEQRFEPWRLPPKDKERVASIALNSQTVRFKLALNYFDPENISITVLQPARARLGKAFQEALQQSGNDKIELNDLQKQDYSWEFYRENPRVGGKRFLDPEKTLIENAIREQSVITAKRVKRG